MSLQAPLPRDFSRQEYWSGLPFLCPGSLPKPGMEPVAPRCRQILYCLSHTGDGISALITTGVEDLSLSAMRGQSKKEPSTSQEEGPHRESRPGPSLQSRETGQSRCLRPPGSWPFLTATPGNSHQNCYRMSSEKLSNKQQPHLRRRTSVQRRCAIYSVRLQQQLLRHAEKQESGAERGERRRDAASAEAAPGHVRRLELLKAFHQLV